MGNPLIWSLFRIKKKYINESNEIRFKTNYYDNIIINIITLIRI